MNFITAITSQVNDKNRCNIFIDGKFFSALSLEYVLKLNLKVGQQLSQKELEEITKENSKSVALNKAINYISKSLKTKHQLKTYLFSKGYTSEEVFYCIGKLTEYGYINDLEFSVRYIESTIKKYGKRLIENKLFIKGVSKENIERAFSRYQTVKLECDGEQAQFESSQTAKTIAQKYMKNKDITRENLAKAYRYLLGKGFNSEEINFALKDFDRDE